MVALIIYLVVGLVAMIIGVPVTVAIRGHKKFHNSYLYMVIGSEVLHKYNQETSQNMNRFVRYFMIVLLNVAWPYKLYWLTKDSIPMIDEAYMNELELLTLKEEL